VKTTPWITLCIAMAIVFVISAAVPARAAPPRQPKNLVLAIAWSDAPTVAAFRRVVDLYNRSHAAARWVVVPDVGNTKLLTQIAAGRSPDLAMLLSAEWVGMDAATGVAVSLDPFIRTSHFDLTQILPAAIAAGTLRTNHQLYSLPFFEDTYMVYYNKDLWARAGLTRAPATLEEMVADARTMTTRRGGRIAALGWDPGDLYGAQSWFGQGLFGCPFTDATGTHIKVTATPCIEALRFLRAAYDGLGGRDGVVRFNSTFSRTFGSPLDPFTDGHEGLYLAGEYESAYIRRYNPALRFGVFPIPPPARHPEMRGYGTEGGNPLIIPRGARDPQAAWDLLSWLVTAGMWHTVRHEYIGDQEAMPTLIPILDRPSLAPTPQMALFWTWYRASRNIRPWPCILVSHEYADLLTTEISAMLVGQATPEGAMRVVQERMSASLRQALAGWRP